MLHIGCHLSVSKGFAHMGREAVSVGADTFQFFTRNPRGGAAKAIDPQDAAELLSIMKEHDFTVILAHAPYTLNPCSPDESVRTFARQTMAGDLSRMEHFPGNYYNFHPGSHVSQGAEKGTEYIADMLNTVMTPGQTTTVLLETMSDKGSEIGGTFEQLRAVIDRARYSDKIGVCMVA